MRENRGARDAVAGWWIVNKAEGTQCAYMCVCALINSGMYFSFVCMYLCMAVCIHGCMGGLQDLGMDVRECVCLHAYIQIDIVRQTYGYICR